MSTEDEAIAVNGRRCANLGAGGWGPTRSAGTVPATTLLATKVAAIAEASA